MAKTGLTKLTIIVALAVAGWAVCGAIMFLGMKWMSMQTTLIVHAVGAPVIFAAISRFTFRRFRFTTPLQTAFAFVGVVIFLDFFLVALVINRSLDMFRSWLGTWLPFALIFSSTYLTGVLSKKRSSTAAAS
jgi:hypothetical protein